MQHKPFVFCAWTKLNVVITMVIKFSLPCLLLLTLKVLVATIDALGHFETG